MTDKSDVHRRNTELRNAELSDKEYIYGLYRPASDALAGLRQTGEEGHIPIILKDTETLLGVILQMKKPQRILEIGAAIGYSASFFSEIASRYSDDARITTIEVDPLYAADAERNLEGRDNVSLVRGDAREVLDGTDEIYDFIFIDAAKSHYAEFWEAVMPHAKSGTVIVCDNVMMKGKTADPSIDTEGRFVTNIKYMRQFLDMITADERVMTSVISAGDGMSISVVL